VIKQWSSGSGAASVRDFRRFEWPDGQDTAIGPTASGLEATNQRQAVRYYETALLPRYLSAGTGQGVTCI
jgi:hypothetical protein